MEVGARKILRKDQSDESEMESDFPAPDGGWGWVVCLAVGLGQMPLMFQFGLIYKDHMPNLGFSASEITTIMNLYNAFSFFVGLSNGPLFRRFSFRKIGIASAMLASWGLFLTAHSSTFLEYALSFGVLYGASFGLFLSTIVVVLNTYFCRRRRMANGIAWTLASLGPFVMPIVTSILLDHYGVNGTVLICSAFVLNSAVCALTFQPVSWHIAKEKVGSFRSIHMEDQKHLQDPETYPDEALPPVKNGRRSRRNEKSSIYQRIAFSLDLDLFKDSNFVITMCGLSVADFVEMNFGMLMAFIFNGYGFSKEQIVTLLSLMAGVDSCMRLLIPLVVGQMAWTNRSFYMSGILISAACRAIVAQTQNYSVIFYTCFLIGIGKAITAVFLNLVISSCVPIKRLPAATGLQLTMSGIFTISMGPVVGVIQQKYSVGTMLNCLNVLTGITVVLWSYQNICCRRK